MQKAVNLLSNRQVDFSFPRQAQQRLGSSHALGNHFHLTEDFRKRSPFGSNKETGGASGL